MTDRQTKLSRLQRRILEFAALEAMEQRPLLLRRVVAIQLESRLAGSGSRRFPKRELGARYKRTMAAVSRAVRRLEDRGLVVRVVVGRGSALQLTAEGLKHVEGLTVSPEPRGGRKRKRTKNPRPPKPLVAETSWPELRKKIQVESQAELGIRDAQWEPVGRD